MKKKRKSRSIPSCKKCGHGVDYHALGKFEKIVSFFVLGIYSSCMVGPWCKCRQFVPKDNLRYLEWRYAQKENIKCTDESLTEELTNQLISQK